MMFTVQAVEGPYKVLFHRVPYTVIVFKFIGDYLKHCGTGGNFLISHLQYLSQETHVICTRHYILVNNVRLLKMFTNGMVNYKNLLRFVNFSISSLDETNIVLITSEFVRN